ncbi:MAG: DNA translocase FtsK [bacterium]
MSRTRKKFSTSIISYLPSLSRRLREAVFLFLAPTGIYIFTALLSYKTTDPGWSNSASYEHVANIGGVVGAWLSDLLFYLFGFGAYAIPVAIIWFGWRVFKNKKLEEPDSTEFAVRLVGFLLVGGTLTGLAHMHAHYAVGSLPHGGGGIAGDMIASGLMQAFGFLGATIFLFSLLLAGFTLMTGLSWFQIMDLTGRWSLDSYDWLLEKKNLWKDKKAGSQAREIRHEVRKKDKIKRQTREPVKIEPVIAELEVSDRSVEEKQQPLFDSLPISDLPPLGLLNLPPGESAGFSEETLELMARQVEYKLADFNIDVQVVAVKPGPVITRFELKLAAGTKVAQISNLAKDLARGLSVISVRVVEVIPGKPVIGLEIPNENREIVYLSEMLSSKEFDKSKSPLSLALGKDIGGKPVVVDLAKMPHVLVAGTTGSGKSVGINAMILSLLYKATHEQVRMIMVDPKMLELSVYEGIPHLLSPVVTDMKDAANALRWCVGEMERRYQLMAALGVRNLAGYNKKVRDAIKAGQPIPDPLYDPERQMGGPKDLETMPSIVVIIDEFADLMMIVGKKIEELIARLAQKARAAGVHLVLATQRPSVDVITGLIKANIPTRMAFQVSSKIDSRTILDQMGAEQLLGHGDMLYLPPGSGIPERVHGAYVADDEVHAAVKYLKTHYEANYNDEVLNETQTMVGGQTISETGLPQDHDAETDPLYDQAVMIVTTSRKASISNLQRRLKVGYNRAARMIEDMEMAGIVSQPEHNGSREVLAPKPPKD